MDKVLTPLHIADFKWAISKLKDSKRPILKLKDPKLAILKLRQKKAKSHGGDILRDQQYLTVKEGYGPDGCDPIDTI